jgi:hypothetical protein
MLQVISKPTPVKAEKKEEYKIIKIKRYKLRELAEIYEVNRKTFRGWLDKFKEELGMREGHYYSISQVRIIFSKLELPSYVKVYID